MKTFNVYLRDGRIAKVHAERFRHEGEHYVFHKAGTSETQFFIDCEVAGISEADSLQAAEVAPMDEGNRSPLAKKEEEVIVRALAECGGNRTHTAKKLGISRRALIYKLKRLGKTSLHS